jgi:hypothetical protein
MQSVIASADLSHLLRRDLLWTGFHRNVERPMPFPALPPRLELVVLLVGVATGYNLAMQILPRERIDLARLGSDEQFAESAADQPADPPFAPQTLSVSFCRIPAGGGPALNERFEPC